MRQSSAYATLALIVPLAFAARAQETTPPSPPPAQAPAQPVMLQTIVTDDHITFGMRGTNSARGIHSISPHPNGYACIALQQQWFIAHLGS